MKTIKKLAEKEINKLDNYNLDELIVDLKYNNQLSSSGSKLMQLLEKFGNKIVNNIIKEVNKLEIIEIEEEPATQYIHDMNAVSYDEIINILTKFKI